MHRLLIALLLLIPVSVRASCGTADCPSHPAPTTVRPAGAVELGYEFEYVPQTEVKIRTKHALPRDIRGHHDEEYTVSRVHRLKAGFDFTERLGLDLQIPWVSRSHGHVHRHQGQDHADHWSLDGFGDVAATARVAFWKGEQATVWALGGVKFPTGKHDRGGDEGQEAEMPIQTGTGSLDWTAGLAALRPGEIPLFASIAYRVNGETAGHYRIGNVLQANVGGTYPLLEKLRAALQLNLRHNRMDSKGSTGEEVGKTGSTTLYVSPGMEVSLTPALTARAVVQVPVYQNVRSIQLVSPYNLIGGLTWRLRG
jgi:hypothetical protein